MRAGGTDLFGDVMPTKASRFDNNEECVAMLNRLKGSLENRIREAYNKGYKDGLRDGASQVTAKIVSKILEEGADDE